MKRHDFSGEFCGNSSVGRAQPCQGWGREFESRFPLQAKKPQRLSGVFYTSPSYSGWVAEWLCSGLQSRGRRFDSDPSLVFGNQFSVFDSPGGGIGRRKGLKIPRDLISCRFDSGLGHRF